MEPKIAADPLTAGGVIARPGEPRADQDLGGVEGAGGDHYGTCLNRLALPLRVEVLDPRRLEAAVALLEEDPLHRRLRPQIELADRGRVVDVGVHRALARVGWAALKAGPALHAVGVRVGLDRPNLRAQLAEAGGDCLHALGPVAPLSDAQIILHPLVVRCEVFHPKRSASLTEQTTRLVPFRELEVVGAKRHFGVERGGAADAAATEHRDPSSSAAVDHRHAKWPPEVLRGLGLPADEVSGGQVRAGLEQHHIPPPLCKLPGYHAPARTRADHNDVDLFAHPGTPMKLQSCLIRSARGKRKSISSQAPGPSAPGATKSL